MGICFVCNTEQLRGKIIKNNSQRKALAEVYSYNENQENQFCCNNCHIKAFKKQSERKKQNKISGMVSLSQKVNNISGEISELQTKTKNNEERLEEHTKQLQPPNLLKIVKDEKEKQEQERILQDEIKDDQ